MTPEPVITQEALDRLERNLKEFISAIVEANDRRYEQRFKDSQTAVDAALNAAKEAVLKAEDASEKRFEGVNEFRQTLGDQQRTLMPRIEAVQRMETIERSVDELKRSRAVLDGQRAGSKEGWGAVVATIGVVGVIIGIVGGIVVLAIRFAKP